MIYLDNSATTRVCERAVKAANLYMTREFFNPSSAYSPAVAAERAVNGARARLAAVLSAAPEEIIFTSGGTESNNMAISGWLSGQHDRRRLIISGAEHPSVLESANAQAGYAPEMVPVTAMGSVDMAALEGMLGEDTGLVSIMHVNNEVGAVNDITAVYRMLKRRAPHAVLHSDGVQAFLKLDAASCDMYSISAHKFHGPKGVGALYVRGGVKFTGGQRGGGQERGMRSGTINTAGIMGMDAAITEYLENQASYRQTMRACKLRLAKNLASLPDVLLNGPAPEDGAPHILNASFLGVRGEVLLHALEEKEIYVATGSACSSHKKGKNRILTAMGITGERQEGALRFSLCPDNTPDEMDRAAETISELLMLLRRFKRR